MVGRDKGAEVLIEMQFGAINKSISTKWKIFIFVV